MMAKCGWFPNIRAAKSFCGSLLTAEEYAEGEYLNRFDRMLLLSVLDWAHSCGYGKVGNYPDGGMGGGGFDEACIKEFSVRRGRWLVAHFLGGPDIAFVWQKLFTADGGKEWALSAMRGEVAKVSQAWLAKNPACAICGAGAASVDHVEPFANLALSWLVSLGLDWDDVQTRFIRLGEWPRRVFTDGELRKSWYHYHKEKAELRSLCNGCHNERLGMNERKVLG